MCVCVCVWEVNLKPNMSTLGEKIDEIRRTRKGGRVFRPTPYFWFVCFSCLVEKRKSGFVEVWTFWLNWTQGRLLDHPFSLSPSKYYENTINPIPLSHFNLVLKILLIIIISNLLS